MEQLPFAPYLSASLKGDLEERSSFSPAAAVQARLPAHPVSSLILCTCRHNTEGHVILSHSRSACIIYNK